MTTTPLADAEAWIVSLRNRLISGVIAANFILLVFALGDWPACIGNIVNLINGTLIGALFVAAYAAHTITVCHIHEQNGA